MAALVILVNTHARTLRRVEALLSDAGYLVAAVTSFAQARSLVDTVMPDLLVADVRAEPANGMRLAIRNRLNHPEVPVIVVTEQPTAAVEAEATHYGIHVVADAPEDPGFLSHVEDVLARSHRLPRAIRRWVRQGVAGEVAVRAAHVDAHVIDMSYGGVRLAFGGACYIPATFDITWPPGEAAVRAHRIWIARSGAGDRLLCGAELEGIGRQEWRNFVDAVTIPPAPKTPPGN
jgi:CheY-like chemotaxis protein